MVLCDWSAGPGLVKGFGFAFFRTGSPVYGRNKTLGFLMLKRVFAALGVITILAALTLPSFAVEGVGERQERRKREAQAYPQQAYEALQKNELDRAIELYTKAIDSRAFKDQPQTLGEIYFGRGNAYRLKKDCTTALVDYNKAAETLQEGDLYLTMAACYLELKQEDQALVALDTAVKLDPDAAMYRSARCKLLFNRKDFAGAVPDCEKALAATPDDKYVLTAASQAAEQTGNRPRAAELYRKLLAVDPGNPIATEGLKRLGG